MNVRTLGLALVALLAVSSVACSAADDADPQAEDAPSADNDLTGSASTPAQDFIKLSPLGDAPLQVDSNGRHFRGVEMMGSETHDGQVCSVRVFHYDATADAPAFAMLEIAQGGTLGGKGWNHFELGSNKGSLRNYKVGATSMHFEGNWVYDQAYRNHEVDVVRFDSKGGGVTIRVKKLGFDEVLACHDLHLSMPQVRPTPIEGE